MTTTGGGHGGVIGDGDGGGDGGGDDGAPGGFMEASYCPDEDPQYRLAMKHKAQSRMASKQPTNIPVKGPIMAHLGCMCD